MSCYALTMNTYCLAHPLRHSLVLLHSDQHSPFGPLPLHGVTVSARAGTHPPSLGVLPMCHLEMPHPSLPHHIPCLGSCSVGFLSPTSRLDAGGRLCHGKYRNHDLRQEHD